MEKPAAKYSDSKFLPSAEDASAPAFTNRLVDWLSPKITFQVEHRNLIPQRNCDRFSRSSMNPQVPFCCLILENFSSRINMSKN